MVITFFPFPRNSHALRGLSSGLSFIFLVINLTFGNDGEGAVTQWYGVDKGTLIVFQITFYLSNSSYSPNLKGTYGQFLCPWGFSSVGRVVVSFPYAGVGSDGLGSAKQFILVHLFSNFQCCCSYCSPCLFSLTYDIFKKKISLM